MRHLSAVFLCLFFSACNSQSGADDVTTTGVQAAQLQAQTEAYKVQVLNLINSYRDSKGVVRLLRTLALENQVQAHTHDMSDRQVAFGHSGMSGRCERSREELGGGNSCGEIVAWGQSTPQEVFDAWIASPQHRERIVQGNYNRAGVGFSLDDNGYAYWGILFLEK